MWALLSVTVLSLVNTNAIHTRGKPAVDPGLFMLMGVKTCRDGSGYCLMGLDCTLDDDFLPDDTGGHCNGLKNAFTPSAIFTCCKYNTDRDHITTTRRPRPGLMKPTSTTTTETTNETSSELAAATTDEAITFTTAADNVDVFLDINNEVIKEVVPPILDGEEAERTASVISVL